MQKVLWMLMQPSELSNVVSLAIGLGSQLWLTRRPVPYIHSIIVEVDGDDGTDNRDSINKSNCIDLIRLVNWITNQSQE